MPEPPALNVSVFERKSRRDRYTAQLFFDTVAEVCARYARSRRKGDRYLIIRSLVASATQKHTKDEASAALADLHLQWRGDYPTIASQVISASMDTNLVMDLYTRASLEEHDAGRSAAPANCDWRTYFDIFREVIHALRDLCHDRFAYVVELARATQLPLGRKKHRPTLYDLARPKAPRTPRATADP